MKSFTISISVSGSITSSRSLASALRPPSYSSLPMEGNKRGPYSLYASPNVFGRSLPSAMNAESSLGRRPLHISLQPSRDAFCSCHCCFDNSSSPMNCPALISWFSSAI